jgi:glycosyltransferase involved in cell wall biosynthesis
MRILIDAHMLGKNETGNETYIINLLRELSTFDEVICGAVISPDTKLPIDLLNLRIEFIRLVSTNDWKRLFFDLPKICNQWNADILHCTYIGPFTTQIPLVVTVHDVTFNRYPEYFSLRDRLLFSTLFRLTMRKADKIITVSEHSKKEISHYYPKTKNKIDVTLEAASSEFSINKKNLDKQFLTQYKIHGKYILSVGNLQPRKNLIRLIQAFARINHTYDHELKLVIVGKAKWQSSKIYSIVNSLNIRDDVIFTGYVSNQDLLNLYKYASVFVYPSFYEGFGLPILEAMACGTPVIASKTSSMPEVAGTAAIFIDPYNEDQLAEAIIQVLSDPILQAVLSTSGIERASKFSWNKTARETIEIYKQLL